MLPYTPLHHLLLGELGFPVVATSGNLSEEPICIEEREALARLRGLADLFLVHNRPIVRHVDDSVVQIAAGRPMVLRRSRAMRRCGLRAAARRAGACAWGASQEYDSRFTGRTSVLKPAHRGPRVGTGACRISGSGGGVGGRVPCDASAGGVRPSPGLSQYTPGRDARFAGYARATPFRACPFVHGRAWARWAPAWGGLGRRGLWDRRHGVGGEFLRVTRAGYERAGRLRPFPLPGGDAAAREPRRVALGLLSRLFGEAYPPEAEAVLAAFSGEERRNLSRMVQQRVRTPETSSVGRLFDAVASLTGLVQVNAYEGEGAVAVEQAARRWGGEAEAYPLPLAPWGQGWELDWAPLVGAVLKDLGEGLGVPAICARFHRGLAQAVLDVAEVSGLGDVVLTGGASKMSRSPSCFCRCFGNTAFSRIGITASRRMMAVLRLGRPWRRAGRCAEYCSGVRMGLIRLVFQAILPGWRRGAAGRPDSGRTRFLGKEYVS